VGDLGEHFAEGAESPLALAGLVLFKLTGGALALYSPSLSNREVV
jgi:hypothetical protein